MTRNHGSSLLFCGLCNSIFKTMVSLERHERNQHSLSFECPECLAPFTKKSEFNLHYKSHNMSQLYQCLECPVKVGTRELFEKHSKAHQEFSFKCSKCPTELTNRTKFVQHQKSHYDNHREDECKKCAKKIVIKSLIESLNLELVELERNKC